MYSSGVGEGRFGRGELERMTEIRGENDKRKSLLLVFWLFLFPAILSPPKSTTLTFYLSFPFAFFF